MDWDGSQKTKLKAFQAEAKKITAIELEIGSMAGIELEALEFAWPVAVKDTVLAEAKREIDWVEAKARCAECQFEFDVENSYDSCPQCKSYFKDIYRGKELRVKSLEIEN